MRVRGELYRLGSWVVGREWRKRLRDFETASPQTMESDALAALLLHAREHVPYYRDLDLPDLQLSSFPLLSREVLRTQFERLKSDDPSDRKWTKGTTGGSTGEPVWFARGRNSLQWDKAADLYLLSHFCGISPADFMRSRRIFVWHQRRRLFQQGQWLRQGIARMLGQIVRIEPYEILSESKLTEFVQRINRHKPEIIYAFAGTVFEIAKHAQRKGIALHRPRCVVTSVEMLYPAMRATLEEAFQCPVHDMYGAAEVGRVACTCNQGTWHVLTPHNHIEILNPDNSPTAPGEMGRIVVTSLHSHAMPFIRYDIGDLARVATAPCSCGSPLPTLDEICGRVVHHFVRPDGALVFGGNFIAMFYEHEWMQQFYILQEDVDRISISFKLLPGSQIPKGAIESLTAVVRNVMGADCRITWTEVDVVPNSPVGKHLHTRSLVWEEQVQRRDR